MLTMLGFFLGPLGAPDAHDSQLPRSLLLPRQTHVCICHSVATTYEAPALLLLTLLRQQARAKRRPAIRGPFKPRRTR